MKKITLQLISILLASISYIGLASAIPITGSLASPSGSVDLYKTTCSKNVAGKKTNQFIVRVKAVKGVPRISVQAYRDSNKNGKFASNSTDIQNSDAVFSPDAIITKGGNGSYTVLVNKSGIGPINYIVDMSCQTKANAPAGQTKPILVQNQ